MRNEWNYRWNHNKEHKAVQMMEHIRPASIRLPNKGLTEFARTVPEEYIEGTVVDTYRNFYCSKEFATWKRRPIPKWWMPPQTRPTYLKPGVSVEYAKM
jgi:hypothetical protein